MTCKLKTAILGATGYSGFELARILLRHPRLETPVMLQRSGETTGANLADLYPAISGNGGYPMEPLSWSELQRQKIELLFLARRTKYRARWFRKRLTAESEWLT